MRFGRLLLTSPESAEASDSETRGVFGSSLTSRLRHTGRAVAPCITRALQYINDSAARMDGLFRRPGVLSRVQKLQEIMNDDSGNWMMLLKLLLLLLLSLILSFVLRSLLATQHATYYFFPKAGPKTLLVVVVVVVVISSLEIFKAFLKRSGAQQNFVYSYRSTVSDFYINFQLTSN